MKAIHSTSVLLLAFGTATLRSAPGAADRFIITAGASSAAYAVDEVFLLENNRLFTAVGVTTDVTGEIVLDQARPANSRIVEVIVDLRRLKSDSERRDRALRIKYLDTQRFPHARLHNATLEDMPAVIVPGRRFRFTIIGDLTVHGVTRRTIWPGEATLVGDTLRGHARTSVKMSSFGIEVPRLLSLRSADDVLLTIDFVAEQAVPTVNR